MLSKTSTYWMARLLIAAVLFTAACTKQPALPHSSDPPLPLRAVGEIPLPGDNSRFDYTSLDPQRGLLFIAHLGASEVVEVDVNAGRFSAAASASKRLIRAAPTPRRACAEATPTCSMWAHPSTMLLRM